MLPMFKLKKEVMGEGEKEARYSRQRTTLSSCRRMGRWLCLRASETPGDPSQNISYNGRVGS